MCVYMCIMMISPAQVEALLLRYEHALVRLEAPPSPTRQFASPVC